MIIVSRDFTTAPGPRLIIEGKFSGEQFRNEILSPAVKHAIQTRTKLVINLDGTSGYGTSFLEESFGGLIRIDKITYVDIKQFTDIISTEEPSLLIEINEYLDDARNQIEKR